jgi:hypothetical protein
MVSFACLLSVMVFSCGFCMETLNSVLQCARLAMWDLLFCLAVLRSLALLLLCFSTIRSGAPNLKRVAGASG